MTKRWAAVYPKVGLLIDGEWIFDRPPLQDIENPSDETILGQVPAASADDLARALEAVQRGFDVWSRTPPLQRSALLRRAAAIVRSRVQAGSRPWTRGIGTDGRGIGPKYRSTQACSCAGSKSPPTTRVALSGR